MMNTSPMLNTTISFTKDGLMETVLTSDELPSFPTVASQLVTLTAREDTTLADVADLVSQDVALCAKILKVANSAFYSFPQQIDSIQQAVSILGTNAVQSLVLSFSFLSINKVGENSHFEFDKFLEKSLASASAAKLILSMIPDADTEEIFVIALLQNIGELILACTLPKEYDKVLAELESEEADPRPVETSIFGADHCYIGYEVVKHWNFPLSISLPILHHHDPLEYVGNDNRIKLYTRAIYLSNVLLNIFYSDCPEAYHAQFRLEAEQMLGLRTKHVEKILREAHTEMDQAAENFELKTRETRPVDEILQEANIRLSLLNLDYEQINKELIKAKMSLENLTKELQEKNELLKNLADMDGLTGIYNNRYFHDALDKELSRTVRKGYQLALVLVDIDKFKSFNDDYGHLVGDFVLTEFSKVLGDNLREYDTLARYGGEEFVVILPETSEEDAAVVAEKLRAAVEAQPFRDEQREYRITASFGVATLQGTSEHVPTKTELIKMADEALYDAKGRGRNRVAAYGPKRKWYKFH